MKKCMLLVALLLWVGCAHAQNVQLHYDFGGALYNKAYDGRPAVSSTVEMFKPDKWGNTFFFVDMDYNDQGVASAYWEIARELSFWESPFAAHLEYNGGVTNASSYENAYLAGATYAYNNSHFSHGFTFTPMYKYIQKHSKPHNFQLTGTWYLHFANNGLCTFSGFADFWREKTTVGEYIFLAEPQLWVNLNKIKGVDQTFNLSVGSELKLSHDFAYREGFFAIPTLAIKWSFE